MEDLLHCTLVVTHQYSYTIESKSQQWAPHVFKHTVGGWENFGKSGRDRVVSRFRSSLQKFTVPKLARSFPYNNSMVAHKFCEC